MSSSKKKCTMICQLKINEESMIEINVTFESLMNGVLESSTRETEWSSRIGDEDQQWFCNFRGLHRLFLAEFLSSIFVFAGEGSVLALGIFIYLHKYFSFFWSWSHSIIHKSVFCWCGNLNALLMEIAEQLHRYWSKKRSFGNNCTAGYWTDNGG